jgi:hypothetical protein
MFLIFPASITTFKLNILQYFSSVKTKISYWNQIFIDADVRSSETRIILCPVFKEYNASDTGCFRFEKGGV